MSPRSFSNISFPSLGIEVNPPRTIELGPLTIHYYGLIIAVGLVLAVWYCSRRAKEFGLTEDHVIDGVLYVTPFAIMCARIYYCTFSWHEFADDPISCLYIWNGGIAIYGGVLGAILGIWVFCKYKKIRLSATLDLVLMGFLIGQSIGRWGNFFNREAFGAQTESFLRMGLYQAKTDTTFYFHPTFLYESLWNAAGFVLLHFLSKKRKFDGQVALGYAAWYGLGRCMIEGLRMDSLWWGPFRVSQLLAGISCVVASGILLWQSTKPHDPAKMFVHQIAPQEAEQTEE